MIIVTVPFNFLDLEDLDADYSQSTEQAIRVASLFQVCASKHKLGECFLSTGPDPFALYIQRIRFECVTGDTECRARVVRDFAVSCRDRLVAESQEGPHQFLDARPVEVLAFNRTTTD